MADLPLPKQTSHGVISQERALRVHQTCSFFTETTCGLTKHKKYTKKHAAPVVSPFVSVCVRVERHGGDTNREPQNR